jgi:hypothetical protein
MMVNGYPVPLGIPLVELVGLVEPLLPVFLQRTSWARRPWVSRLARHRSVTSTAVHAAWR